MVSLLVFLKVLVQSDGVNSKKTIQREDTVILPPVSAEQHATVLGPPGLVYASHSRYRGQLHISHSSAKLMAFRYVALYTLCRRTKCKPHFLLQTQNSVDCLY